jgi:two-component system, NtrC family, response regulator HydG
VVLALTASIPSKHEMTQNKQHILVVDDDQAHRAMLTTLLGGWGYEITSVDDGSTAIEAVKARPFELILMDVRMLKVSGMEALEKIKSYNPSIPVIIMTAYSSIESAVDAIRKGAHDYLTKPLDFKKLKLTIQRATEHLQLLAENQRLKQSLRERFDFQNIIGRSPAMQQVLETVAQVAPSEATVLITGESGTGKELFANAVHHNSHRNQGPLIKVNCAALTETLLESELFGHEKGAFTGAERRKEGCFVLAAGGSLFLDEVSEMPATMQVKLLRVLQEREITRVGGEQVITVDVRLIAATNKDLSRQVREGTFRQDLFYRLNVVGLQIPALRDRREDIPLLAHHFLETFAGQNQKVLKGFTPETMDRLIRYDWPGNVRELMNAVERGVVLCQGEVLDAGMLPLLPPEESQEAMASGKPVPAGDSLSLEAVEKITIINTLNATGGNKSEAARRLGITRKTLREKLKKYGDA